MKLPRSLLELLIYTFAGLAVPASAASQVVGAGPDAAAKAIAKKFFPPSLLQRAPKDRHLPLFEFAVPERLPDGTAKLIVASYTNGAEGVVRVIVRNAAGDYAVAAEPKGFAFRGEDSHVWLVESRPAHLWISFNTGEGTEDWFFGWDGSELVSLGPTLILRNGQKRTLLQNASVLDVYHKGPPSIIAQASDPSHTLPVGNYHLYTYSGQRYCYDRPLISWLVQGTYAIEKRKVNWLQRFAVPHPARGPYSLEVINGYRGGAHRVANGEIILNGQQVVSSSQLSAATEFLRVPVELKANNKLLLNMQPDGDSKVLLLMEQTAAGSLLSTPGGPCK